MSRCIKISEICKEFNLRFYGEDVLINGLGLCNRSSDSTNILSYVTNDRYTENVKNNDCIKALILPERYEEFYNTESLGKNVTLLFCDTSEAIFYQIHEWLCVGRTFYEQYDFESLIGNGCDIAESAVIENGVVIGDNVKIGPNTVVRSGSVIDDNTIVGCNTTIGSEGFQLITDGDNPPIHVTHVGKCRIGRNVYVGDNSCICNSLFDGETYVGDNAKIDNLCHISHNLYIGAGAVITAHVILCGSSRVEDGVWIGPNSSVLNRVTIGCGAKVGLGSVVTRDVPPHTLVYGVPAKAH